MNGDETRARKPTEAENLLENRCEASSCFELVVSTHVDNFKRPPQSSKSKHAHRIRIAVLIGTIINQESNKTMKVNPVLAHKLETNKKIMATSSAMDGPSVPFAPNDLFKFNTTLFMIYHCSISGYDYLSPLGCAIGTFAVPVIPRFRDLTRLQAAGTGAILAGGTGMGLGCLALINIATMKEPKLPWDEGGRQNRVDGLCHNYRVRCMDLGVCLGAIGGAAAVAYNGGPTKLGLSAGTLGKLQAIGLGSAAASVLTNVFIAMTK